MASPQTSSQDIVAWAERKATDQPRAPLGRPPTLTEPLIQRIGDLLLTGIHPSTAARAVGVPERTFERWKANGQADDDADKDTIYAALWRHIDQKAAEGECMLIADAGSGRMGWQGPMTVASRRYRERWEDKQLAMAGMTINIGINADAVQLTPSPQFLSLPGEGQEIP